jgi:hypothetical protein
MTEFQKNPRNSLLKLKKNFQKQNVKKFKNSIEYKKIRTVGNSRSHIPPEEIAAENLILIFKGNVAAEHIIKEDSQGPDGSGGCVENAALNPFGRTVDFGSRWEKKSKSINRAACVVDACVCLRMCVV